MNVRFEYSTMKSSGTGMTEAGFTLLILSISLATFMAGLDSPENY
jgi:hypothetical protein